MGNRWEVYDWVETPTGPCRFAYVLVYGGPSWIAAVLCARRLKRANTCGCVKVEWRR